MRNQILAMIIVAIMRFYLGTSLVIISSSQDSRMSYMNYITQSIIFCAACFYSMKIKLCPDLKNHLLLTIIETTIGIAVIEFLMGLWCSVEKIIMRIVKCGLNDDVRIEKSSNFADMIIMGMAACVLLTVLIDGQVVEKVMAYYNKNKQEKCASKNCAPQQPRGRAQFAPQRPIPVNPNCPCHGDNAMACNR